VHEQAETTKLNAKNQSPIASGQIRFLALKLHDLEPEEFKLWIQRWNANEPAPPRFGAPPP
jgi:hypothetical protein